MPMIPRHAAQLPAEALPWNPTRIHGYKYMVSAQATPLAKTHLPKDQLRRRSANTAVIRTTRFSRIHRSQPSVARQLAAPAIHQAALADSRWKYASSPRPAICTTATQQSSRNAISMRSRAKQIWRAQSRLSTKATTPTSAQSTGASSSGPMPSSSSRPPAVNASMVRTERPNW